MLEAVESAAADKNNPESERPRHVRVDLWGISPAQNDRLTAYFSETISRARLYYLLASLVRHQSIRTANAMAFDLFLALVPMLGLAGWAAALFGGATKGSSLTSLFSQLTPAQLSQFIGHHFEALAAAHLAPVAALAGMWLSSSAFNTMIGVFQETFDCVPRSWIRCRLLALGFALLGMLLLGLGATVAVWIAVAPGIGTWVAQLRSWGILSWMFGLGSLLTSVAFLALLYRVSIARPGRRRHVWTGAFAATGMGALASLSLGYYAAHIARYALFYGGLAAIVVVLLWLWLLSTAILVGAEINIALEDVAFEKSGGAPGESLKPQSGSWPAPLARGVTRSGDAHAHPEPGN